MLLHLVWAVAFSLYNCFAFISFCLRCFLHIAFAEIAYRFVFIDPVPAAIIICRRNGVLDRIG